MISYEDALKIILKETKCTDKIKSVSLFESINSFVSEDVFAPFDMPLFSNSAMDGYAIQYKDTLNADKRPVRLKIVGEVKTGVEFRGRLKNGQALAISTGSRLPEGADSVIMKEDVRVEDGYIIISKVVKNGENVRFRGEELRKGSRILKIGQPITPSVIGLLAVCGFKQVKVFRKPIVGFISSGSELVEPGKVRKDYEIYNSNYYSIRALLNACGFDVKYYGIVKDDYRQVVKRVKNAIDNSDVLLVSGGVSVGNVDLIKDVFNAVGIKEYFWRAKIKPGKPLFFGKKGEKIVFGLPGNPVSSFVSCFLFVLPAIRKMSGSKCYLNQEILAELMKDLKKSGERREFIRAFYNIEDGRYRVTPFLHQGSAMMSALSAANCLIVTDYGSRIYKKGEYVNIFKLW